MCNPNDTLLLLLLLNGGCGCGCCADKNTYGNCKCNNILWLLFLMQMCGTGNNNYFAGCGCH